MTQFDRRPIVIPLDRSRKLIRREPLMHAMSQPSILSMGNRITVCTALIYHCLYDATTNDVGGAIIAAFDRKLTDTGLGIGYEGSRFKATFVPNGQMILVAGDIVVHTAIHAKLSILLKERQPPSTSETAKIIGDLICEYRRIESSRLYLSPLNLDADLFLKKQKTMEPSLVIELTNQLQQYKIDVESMVVGVDDQKASLYRIDAKGLITDHSGIGFLSIGSGGIHSNAYFMMNSYTHNTKYHRALYHTFAAKKRAEVDPYVGPYTDMFLVHRNVTSPIPRKLIDELESIYEDKIKYEDRLIKEAEIRLVEAEKIPHLSSIML